MQTSSAPFSGKNKLNKTPAARRVAATAFTVLGLASFGYLFLQDIDDAPLTLGLPLVGMTLSLLLLHSRHLGAQMLARSFWWTSLILGMLIAGAANNDESLSGVGLALGAGGALLAMGRLGISNARERGSFVPVAFTGALTVGLVMALADLQTLIMWGGVLVGISKDFTPAAFQLTGVGMLASAGVMLVAIVGLYRLRMWGVALNIVANVAIATCALTVFDLPEFIAYALATTAVVQLLLPLPMLYAMATKKVVKDRARRWSHLAAPAAISAMMVASVLVYDTRLFQG
jgi:uncharacterized membrane protein (DUF2068 family)